MRVQKLIIEKNKNTCQPVYVKDDLLKFVGFPIDPKTQIIGLKSNKVSFEVSFDGAIYHTVNDYTGKKLSLPISAVQEVDTPDNYLDPSFAVLPIKEPNLFEGMIMIRPVLNAIENEQRIIEFYLG